MLFENHITEFLASENMGLAKNINFLYGLEEEI